MYLYCTVSTADTIFQHMSKQYIIASLKYVEKLFLYMQQKLSLHIILFQARNALTCAGILCQR